MKPIRREQPCCRELKKNVLEELKSFEAKRRTDNNDYIEFEVKDWFEFKKKLGLGDDEE